MRSNCKSIPAPFSAVALITAFCIFFFALAPVAAAYSSGSESFAHTGGDWEVIYALSGDEAYSILQQHYQAGMDHYREMQEADNEISAEYYDDFQGNTPLYCAYLDVTGNGLPEMLFLATPDSADEWESDSADLFIYSWMGNRAELILRIEHFYEIAGNGPWYEIYQDGSNSAALYFRYGCDSPGTQAKYELDENGKYTLSMSAAGYMDYESGSEDALSCYVLGAPARKDEYDAALALMDVQNKILIASTLELVS